MAGKGIVAKLEAIHEIPGADRIVEGVVLGERVIIPKNQFKVDDVGVLFDTETQLSHEFVHRNNLYRDPKLNSDGTTVGLFDSNRRIRPIKLRGVKCSAYFVPFSMFWAEVPSSLGVEFDSLEGVPVCNRYVRENQTYVQKTGEKKKKVGQFVLQGFVEHFDTPQLLRSLRQIPTGRVIVTPKYHGTSGRVARVKVHRESSKFTKFVRNILDRFGFTKKEEWVEVVGSRTVVKHIEGVKFTKGQGYYDSDVWSAAYSKHFKGKLRKGEELFFEIVGYTPSGRPIQKGTSLGKIKDFLTPHEYSTYMEMFGDSFDYTYDCPPREFKVVLYRATQLTPDGDVLELEYEQMVRRAKELGVEAVPTIVTSTFTSTGTLFGLPIEDTQGLVGALETFSKYPSSHTNIPEGVCIRTVDGCIYKYKTLAFRAAEGLVTVPDLEEEN